MSDQETTLVNPIEGRKSRRKCTNIYKIVDAVSIKFCGYSVQCVTSVDAFTKLLFSPRDASSLGVARMLFGLMMLFDIPDERSGFELDVRWGDEKDCRFPLFPFLKPLALPKMAILYAVMWLGALGITLGYKFKASCLMFTIPYWYIFLLDKSSWNNHSYLFGLLATLFACTQANASYSLDAYLDRNSKKLQTVPFWNYFIIKFQFYILYTYAGIKKVCPEWLSGYAMTYLSNHWVFTPFRIVLGTNWTDFLIVHWFGCIFDLTITFWLTYGPTRPIGTVFATLFHLMNSRLFAIGMFPWVCLVQLPIFYYVAWPTRVWTAFKKKSTKEAVSLAENKYCSDMNVNWTHRRTTWLIFSYMALQLFLPNSHFITKGYNNWTNGLYGYSWDMMVHSWSTTLISIKVVDNKHNKVMYMDPYAFSDSNRWTRHADMAVQYGQCIKRHLEQGLEEISDGEERISIENISVYFDVWCSLNKRFQQRVFDPHVDILTAAWSPFEETKWSLPLLTELTDLRPKMVDITRDVFRWSNYSDVLFIADFPNMSLDNYIAVDLDNVTITVIVGSVRLEYDSAVQDSVTLTKGQFVGVRKGLFHKVSVVSGTPACYMYTFTNGTLEASPVVLNTDPPPPMLPIWDELKGRWNKFVQFIRHVGNSLLYEAYGVPMPRLVRI